MNGTPVKVNSRLCCAVGMVYAVCAASIVTFDPRALDHGRPFRGFRSDVLGETFGRAAVRFYPHTTRPVHRSARVDPKGKIPLGRRGEAEEIAAVVRFLCGPGGGFITGQTIHVNGGDLIFA